MPFPIRIFGSDRSTVKIKSEENPFVVYVLKKILPPKGIYLFFDQTLTEKSDKPRKDFPMLII